MFRYYYSSIVDQLSVVVGNWSWSNTLSLSLFLLETRHSSVKTDKNKDETDVSSAVTKQNWSYPGILCVVRSWEVLSQAARILARSGKDAQRTWKAQKKRTEKKNNKAYSKVSKKGKPARTEVTPEIVSGKKTKVKCVIHHGRTHQIRVHLKSIDFPIIGDEQYGGRRYKRVMLHARKVVLLGMTFEAAEPTAFKHFES